MYALTLVDFPSGSTAKLCAQLPTPQSGGAHLTVRRPRVPADPSEMRCDSGCRVREPSAEQSVHGCLKITVRIPIGLGVETSRPSAINHWAMVS